MQFDPERGRVDCDGFATFLLTLLLVLLTFGIPLWLSLRRVFRIAASAPQTVPAQQLLVFGKRLLRGRIDKDYRSRLEKAAQLMHQNPQLSLLLLGGAAGEGEISESQAGERFLLTLGIEGQRMAREEESQNTLENLRRARDLLLDQPNRSLVMISNRYHLARIQTMAGSLGIPHRLCAAEPRFRLSLSLLPRLLIEAWYILWFNTGKGWARLIHSQRMLDRVT